LGQQEPDAWTIHLEDTLRAGRGLCNEELSALLCQKVPSESRNGAVGAQARGKVIKQEMAPGHSRKRCCFVDFLNTGPRWRRCAAKSARFKRIRRISNIAVIEILVKDGQPAARSGFTWRTASWSFSCQGGDSRGGGDQALRNSFGEHDARPTPSHSGPAPT
jgi:succinate dehydrogenase / fumarate reductase flavoprotein subunit/fumarate reductase (CoM/CoB) subunit A